MLTKPTVKFGWLEETLCSLMLGALAPLRHSNEFRFSHGYPQNFSLP